MAEPIRPADDTPGGGPVAEGSPATTPSEPVLLAPPTDEELAQSGEPTADEIHAAAGGDAAPVRPAEAPAAPAPPAATAPAAAATEPPPPPPVTEDRTEAGPAVGEPAPPVQPQPVLAPAAESAPAPPRARGNRVPGIAWVLLAAGLFQVLFFGINGLVALTFGGPAAAVPQMQQIAGTPLAWLPVLLFFLLYALTVLLLNRAGRVAYVFASLIIAIVVYIASTLLFSLMERHTLGDANTLAQTFLNWEFILIGLVARETMLWTGLAVGSRGIRVRRRNKEERARYDGELADA